jgi:hypothetical protein
LPSDAKLIDRTSKMEKQEVKSKWDELARQLGADISPETEQLVESVPIPTSEAESWEAPSTETVPVPVPKRHSAGWDTLANEFGLAVPEPQDKASVENVDVASPPRIAARVETAEKPKPQRRRPEPRDDPRKWREPREQREPHEPREEAVTVRHEDVPQAVPTRSVAPQPTPPRDEPAKPAAVSLWQKIFGVPADQAARSSDATAEDNADAAAKLSGQDEDDYSALRDEAGIQDTDQQTGSAISETSAAVREDELGQTTRRRSRRRRRGQGGRGRRSAGESDETHEIDRGHRRPTRRVKRDERDHERRARPVNTELSDDGSEDLDSRLSDDDDELEAGEHGTVDAGEVAPARSRSALQRSIPSWEEAIGYIVDFNMQSRSQRRQSTHSGSRSNPSHARRGRRKN